MKQMIIDGTADCADLNKICKEFNINKFLLVCGSSFYFLPNKSIITNCTIPYVVFSEFTPNPLYEDVCLGVELFNREKCDGIIAVGGGSALDVAKCIKLFSKMDKSESYLKQEYRDSGICLIAIPTTAGTGSESTRFAVIYHEGKKQSVAHESIIPNIAILDHSVLNTLPLYQKKCTMLDALCQGIESWWSVNSTDESMEYSQKSIALIMANYKRYLFGNCEEAAHEIMIAANYAGRAINITQTTAAHAMSYKITSLYRLPHGHAVAVCLPHIWKYMYENPQTCIDSRGCAFVMSVFEQIARSLGENTVEGAITSFNSLINDLDIACPQSTNRERELRDLIGSVNPDRLKNTPMLLTPEVIGNLYSAILK